MLFQIDPQRNSTGANGSMNGSTAATSLLRAKLGDHVTLSYGPPARRAQGSPKGEVPRFAAEWTSTVEITDVQTDVKPENGGPVRRLQGRLETGQLVEIRVYKGYYNAAILLVT